KELKRAQNVEINDLGELSWTQRTLALPFPLALHEASISAVSTPGRIVETLDRQMLTVTGLIDPVYTLEIDGQKICAFDRTDLEKGVNIACVETPMLAQARHVQELLRKHADIHELRRQLGVQYLKDESSHLARALSELDAWEEEAVADATAAANPQ